MPTSAATFSLSDWATIRRAPPPSAAKDPWRARVIALVLLGHLIGFYLADRSLRLRDGSASPRRVEESAVEIRFLPPAARDVAAQSPSSLPPRLLASARRVEQSAPPAVSTAPEPGLQTRFLPAVPDTTLETRRLFDPNGTLRLPEDLIGQETTSPETAAPRSPLPYEATRFDSVWVPDGENLGQEWVRRVPLLGLVLQGVHGDRCPPKSTDPECEAQPQEQRASIPSAPQSGRRPW